MQTSLATLPVEEVSSDSQPAATAPPVEEEPQEDSQSNEVETETNDPVVRLERLRARGRFEEFIAGAIDAATENPESAALALLEAEAQLASGRPADGQQSAKNSVRLALSNDQSTIAVQAAKLWVTARMRQGLPLNDPNLLQTLAALPADDAAAAMLRDWCERLAHRAPFRIASRQSQPVTLQLAKAVPGSVPWALNAIQARANGAALPLVFIDTGAQHTIMTVAAAQAAGVAFGSSGQQLVGFAGMTARPGVIAKLELGELVLHDVPVLVGDSTPLVAVQGQMAIGTELMHHVRFSIDYPGRRVTAAPADAPDIASSDRPLWEIPLWTFSTVCLARGQLPDGSMIRTLVDTGDRAGTFISARWARRHLPELRGPTPAMVFKFKKRHLVLTDLQLGSETLATWPILDTMPIELDRLNQVDLLLGHDALWPYQLTIDLPRRVLQLHAGTSPAKIEPPTPPTLGSAAPGSEP